MVSVVLSYGIRQLVLQKSSRICIRLLFVERPIRFVTLSPSATIRTVPGFKIAPTPARRILISLQSVIPKLRSDRQEVEPSYIGPYQPQVTTVQFVAGRIGFDGSTQIAAPRNHAGMS